MTEKVLDYIDYSLGNWDKEDLINEVIRLYKQIPEEMEKWRNLSQDKIHPFENLDFPQEYLNNFEIYND